MSARSEGIDALSLPDIERRLANTVRFGTVMAVDHAKRRLRVKSGDIESNWMPWPAGRAAGGKRRWDPPEVGEQGLMIAPGGDLRQAVFVPGVYQDSHDAPISSPDKDHTTYGDGTVIEYDRGSHTLLADLQGSSFTMTREKIELKIGSTTMTLTNAGTTLTTPLFTVNAPTSRFSGAVIIQGLLSWLAGMFGSGGAGGGNAEINANVTINGNTATNGTLTNNGKNVGSTHSHSGVQSGGSNTGAPV